MLNLAIPIPSTPAKQDIEIEMTLGGKRHKIHYRVELFYWAKDKAKETDRVEHIRNHIKDYNDGWEVYDIGEPTGEFVPLTFVNKNDWIKQHHFLRQVMNM